MDKTKKIFVSAKNHIHAYRGRYSAVATLVVCTAAAVARAKQWNEFLTEHNLLDEFYYTEDE